MIEGINVKMKEAMKAKNKERLNALRYLKSILLENKTAKAPKNEMDVVISYVKKLKDSISTFPEGNEQIEKINLELSHLAEFMPQQLNEDDVKSLITKVISELDSPNMGMVMKGISPQIKGKFDGKRASDMVKEALA